MISRKKCSASFTSLLGVLLGASLALASIGCGAAPDGTDETGAESVTPGQQDEDAAKEEAGDDAGASVKTEPAIHPTTQPWAEPSPAQGGGGVVTPPPAYNGHPMPNKQ